MGWGGNLSAYIYPSNHHIVHLKNLTIILFIIYFNKASCGGGEVVK